MIQRFNRIVAFSAVVLSSVPAGAIGETTIDQAKAIAGGVTPGDAPGFPVTLSRPGLDVLTGNLFPGAGLDGIEVTQRNVTIDFNGFELHGRSIAEHGVFAGPSLGLTVKNGVILEFKGHGVFGSGRSWNVHDMLITNNDGAGVIAGLQAQIKDSEITFNEVGGIGCGSCHIEGNTISANGGLGMSLTIGLVLGNVIADNAGVGIQATPVVGYGNNTLSGNNGDGANPQVTGGIQLEPNACTPACP